MTNKETILRTVQFIEKNLKSDIEVMDIAREGCYSLYHFNRLFQSITGYSPARYLLMRRLTEAAYNIRNSKVSIADIAYEYQFGSPEAFSRAFKKNFGNNPSRIRMGTQSLANLNLLGAITEDYIYQSDKVRNQPPDLVRLQQKFLIGNAFFIRDNQKIENLNREWSQFLNALKDIPNKILPERLYQVQYWSEEQDLGGLYFYLGAEVENIDEVDPQFVVKVIPSGEYLKFIHKGLANKVGYTYKYIYNQYLPETEYKLCFPFNFEYYGEKCLGPDNEQSESEIYIPVAK